MTAGLEVLAGAGRSPLFACVRSLQLPDLPSAVARAFSPRVQQFGRGCAVFDVSGLGRLLGDAHAIGAELQRTCAAHASSPIAVAVAPTQTAAMLLSLTHPSLTVRTGEPAAALSQVPLDALRLLVAERHGIHADTGASPRADSLGRVREGVRRAPPLGVDDGGGAGGAAGRRSLVAAGADAARRCGSWRVASICSR